MLDYESTNLRLSEIQWGETSNVDAGAADLRVPGWAILTIVGATGVDLDLPYSGSCLILKVADMEETLCTSLLEGNSPIWDESFPM